METSRFEQQMRFLVEIDQMKNVLRQTLLADGSRRESDAEHSWHLAMYAMLLSEYAPEPVDVSRVIRMVLVHDLIEIYAGDTFCYDKEGNRDKAAREAAAADQLYALLPADQAGEYRALWEEFDRMDTPDSRFAAALDRVQPIINNYLTEGHTWKLGHVTSAQVYERMAPVKNGLPEAWKVVEWIINTSIEKGFLQP
ncbi:MAG: HD domain-containing protein [Oscillospiraceae bacterium]|nr:HD domain-containing protein [Oscillospiraceae bacterium]MDY3065986.1 HD domain-containing protein [Oscillospiraceae bacterium]